MLLVFISFLCFIFYLDKIQKSNLEKNLLLHQTLRAFQKNHSTFLNLSSTQQQVFLDQLDEKDRLFFLELIENEIFCPSHPQQIKTMNLFASWAKEQKMHHFIRVDYDAPEEYSHYSA